MLWVYINRQGDAECVVNVGNKIRQGDAFQAFIVFWGDNGEVSEDTSASTFNLSNVRYLAPPNLEFLLADATPEYTRRTFYLNNPSQVNNHFMGNYSYNGYLVNIPSAATSSCVNGANIALEINLLDNEGFSHAQTISVFVQPTYGGKVTNITTTDYDTIIDLIKQASFLLSFPMTIAEQNGAYPVATDMPTLFLTKSLGFVHGKVRVSRSALNDAYSAQEQDQTDGFATIAYVNSANVSLKIPATVFGRDQDGNDVQFRLNIGDNGQINLDVYIQDIQDDSGTHEDMDEVTFFGTCWLDAEYLDFSTGITNGRVINKVEVHQPITIVDDPSEADVDVTLEGDEDDSTMTFWFKIPKGEKGDTGESTKLAVNQPSVSVQQLTGAGAQPHVAISASITEPDADNEQQLSMSFQFGLPTQAYVPTQGMYGFSVSEDGFLILSYTGNTTPPLSINANGELIYTY